VLWWLLVTYTIFYLIRKYTRPVVKEEVGRADNEDLVNYSEAVPYDSRQQLIVNECYFRANYGIATIPEEQLMRLKNARTTSNKEKLIEDEPCYKPLEINSYMLQFQYMQQTALQHDGEASDCASNNAILENNRNIM